MTPRVGGVAFGVCVLLAAKPGTRLTRREASALFGVPQRKVRQYLQNAVDYGFLEEEATRQPAGQDGPTYYSAGPQLRRLMES